MFKHQIKFAPKTGTQARLVLDELFKAPSSSSELMKILDCDPRSALQRLQSDKGGMSWLIHNNGTKKGFYRLDDRHLIDDPELDREARKIAKKLYLERSEKQALNGHKRLDRAHQKAKEADNEYQYFLNFEKEDSKDQKD